MSIHVALHHRTNYRYSEPVGHSPHLIRLRPAPHCRTRVLSYSLKVEPRDQFLNWQQDPFGNYVARVVFPEKLGELNVEVDLVAEMAVYNPFDFFLEPGAEEFPFRYDDALRVDLDPFLRVGEVAGGRVGRFLKGLGRRGGRTVDFLVGLNRRLSEEVKYVIRMEPGVQDPEETLALGKGSCRDTAWLLVEVLRRLGLAARFVSGYLIQLKPDVRALDGPAGVADDFTDLHAWCEVYLPGAGWVGLDPTSGLLAGEGHIPLACTPHPVSAAPVVGRVDPCESEFSHRMRVDRIYEAPRVTKPFSEEEWERVDLLGQQVDRELLARDVRLTMGGEPTFVSVEDMDGEEWNFSAVGEGKRVLSDRLLRRLRRRFGAGGVLHHGQGKWYPGESLPRWAYSCIWRRDGGVIWGREDLLADGSVDYGHGVVEAKLLVEELARGLGVGMGHVMPGYEDAFYYMWRERRLPGNVDVMGSRLEDVEERERLARVFDQGLREVVGYVLPLRRGEVGETEWVSGSWFLRRERCYLIPGDSPMGLRLPLDGLPWVSGSDYPYVNAPDPMSYGGERLVGGMGRLHGERVMQRGMVGRGRGGGSGVGAMGVPRKGESADWIVRTALCVEPRGGRLHVFLPPLSLTEDYLELVGVVERSAAALGLPVVLEGSAPGYDPRLGVMRVTPDPGVIEVNVPAVGSWGELVVNTEALYEEARLCRLGTEKFMVDGRHVGTGGGNHMVLGGETPGDSPFLRRPDLLRSLVNYWQHHPSLSFLFSGLFIGPTSQHPRVDEARNDSLHELEVAFAELGRHLDAGGGECPLPWLVDRIFRNLLVDSTGNTHRAEFCIDKLYAPEGATGRLGLVEMRAFEMPPHARMGLVQALLVRALVSRFWDEPYRGGLVRWGSELHDRFMLPHFVEEDFRDILGEMNERGYGFRAEWFGPQFEFRFPRYGEITVRGVNLEVRQALEPWHVLGEQGMAGGTVRHVDSSLDRLQVRVRGMVDSRHVVTCNGLRVPLHPTGVEGEYVAGVRFRAWQPPECLQPTIGVHSPLTFDVVDTWNGRSIGGCVYHVAHPGGRNYTTLPVNAYEAESRRLARYFRMGHTPLRVRVPELALDRDFPFTLDLRRAGGVGVGA
jgi:uncharacterized protein (DUF2126 family)